MSGIVDLSYLIRFSEPLLMGGEFMFLSLPGGYPSEKLSPICTFVEPEGVSVIVPRELAVQAGFVATRAFRQITLRVNSSLNAVGFLAAVAGALASAGIPCNAVSAFHHDHLFIPSELATRALDVLTQLSETPPNEAPESKTVAITNTSAPLSHSGPSSRDS